MTATVQSGRSHAIGDRTWHHFGDDAFIGTPPTIINARLLVLAISLCRLRRVTASTQFGRTPETLDVERCRIGCNQNVAAS